MSIFRIGDRLIHGRVITARIAYADTETIIMADDKAAKDELQQSLLKMATPGSIALKILSVDDAVAYIQSGEGSGEMLLLMRGPEQAPKFIKMGIERDQTNVGSMNMKKDKTKVLDNLWVFPEDMETIRGIHGHGVRLEVRAVPNEHSQNVMELLKRCKLA